MSDVLFLVAATVIGIVLCALGYWLNFSLQLWVLSLFIENPVKRYGIAALTTLTGSLAANPLLILVALPVLSWMVWCDPELNLRQG